MQRINFIFYMMILLLQAYASKGYICVAIDSRYHGERASNENTYIDVTCLSWTHLTLNCAIKI